MEVLLKIILKRICTVEKIRDKILLFSCVENCQLFAKSGDQLGYIRNHGDKILVWGFGNDF